MCANARNKSQHVGSLAKLSMQTSNLRLDFSNVNVQIVSHLFESSFAFVSHVVVLFIDISQAIFFLKKIDQLTDFRLHPPSSSSSVFLVTSRFLSTFDSSINSSFTFSISDAMLISCSHVFVCIRGMKCACAGATLLHVLCKRTQHCWTTLR